MFSPVAVDAEANKEGLFGPLSPQGLEDGVAKEVLDADLGQVPGTEGLVVLPELVGDLRDRRLGDEQLPGGVFEGVFDVSCRQAPGVHLGHQAIEDVRVALQETHESRAERLAGVTHLGQADMDRPFGGADPSTEVVGLLGLQQFLDHQPRHRLDQAETTLEPSSTPPRSRRLRSSRASTDGGTLLIGLGLLVVGWR